MLNRFVHLSGIRRNRETTAMPNFREEQHFAPWVYWIAAAVALAALIAPLVAAHMAKDPSACIPVILMEFFVAVLMLFPLNILFMTTEVVGREVVVSFGRWFPIYRRHIPLHDIQETRTVYYRPIWDAGGWGIRWGRFEGKRCAFLNARGDRGVFLALGSEKRLIIGSQEPERLADAIRRAAGMSR
jgi:hypothetical protein